MHSEQKIFNNLENLCRSTGFIHAIAHFCFRDQFFDYDGNLQASDMTHLFSESRLIRTEITTLIGLMMRGPIDLSLPEPEVLSDYVEQCEALLLEMHKAMFNQGELATILQNSKEPKPDSLTFGKFLREPIFYGGESAYSFQYRDFAPRKYAADVDWLLQHRSIDIEVGREVCRGVCDISNERALEVYQNINDKPIKERSMLSGFEFSCKELSARINQPIDCVRAIVEAFALPENERNAGFTSLQEFNVAYTYPFIRKSTDEFIMLQQYGIAEALYDSPFYWMYADKSYRETASRHRGEFTEAFAADRLRQVFGSDKVFQNVQIEKSKGVILGEIDVLVLFGNRAIALQAKSKKLTHAARKGNDLLLQKDFKAAVQDAVDQAFTCADLLGDPSIRLFHKNRETVHLIDSPRVIFPVAVVADHYPALAYQVRQFLQAKPNEQIVAPLVLDVFALDTITEMLDSPLRLISYLSLRARFGNKMLMSHEHVLLGYHLKNNLWPSPDDDLVKLHDNFSSALEAAMIVRREGIPGVGTPEGILTRMENTYFAQVISDIENETNSAAIELGLLLLTLSEDTVQKFNLFVNQSVKSIKANEGVRHMTINISSESTGLTVHCGGLVGSEAQARLSRHCTKLKYMKRASSWFGLNLRRDGSLQVAIELTGNWKFDDRMEKIIKKTALKDQAGHAHGRKIGRNELCYCGSGRKYKHCCINRRNSSND